MENSTTLDVIKYGTAVLTTQDFEAQGAVDHNIMRQHGRVIDRNTNPTILVSSGAVGFGKIAMNGHDFKDADETTVKRVLAELGQPDLMEAWKESIPHKKVLQKLVTYYDLERQTVKDTVRTAINNNLLYVFNFNDGVDDSELKQTEAHQFGDNDHLAAQVAGFSTEFSDKVRLILNTSADGFMLKGEAKALEKLEAEDITADFIADHCNGTSNGGTGGMGQKLENARQALANGVSEVWIVNGKQPAQLNAVLQGHHAGTLITNKAA